jgi:hypothetical protein
MNRPLPKSAKDFFSARLIAYCILLIAFGESYSQAVSISAAPGGLSTPPLTGGTTNHAIFGVQLTKDAVAANTVTAISFGLSSNPAGKFSNARLYESSDGTFDGVGSETLIATGTLSATNVSFSGTPLTNFDGAGALADTEFFFVVVNVDAAATGTITPSLASAGVTVSAGSVSGSTITGTAFDFLTADFTQNTDDATALADQNGVVLLDFTVNSNGTQSLNSTLTFTFDTDVTNILENFDFQVGGATIGGVVTYPLTGGGTILTVTGFNSEDVTNATTFTLLADIKAGAASGDDFIISLASSGVTISPGIPEAFAPFTNSVDVTGLEADFTQNAASTTALADEDDVTLLDFTVNSNGTQSLNSTLTFTFNTNVTSILENFELQVGGATIGGVVTYPLTGGGTILTVTGFNSEDVTNATTFTLLADIKIGATSANDFTISLAASGVNVSPGAPEAFTTFMNSIDVSALEADFTQNAADATAVADENGVELLDFTVNSNGTQTLSPNLVFTFNKDITNILENGDFEVDGVDVPGASFALTGGGTILTISGFAGIDVTSARNFQLFADVQAGATVTDDFTISLVPGGVNIAPGSTETFGTISNSIDIVTSQLSDIILNGGTTTDIPYINKRTGNPLTTGNSVSLATFQIRDGAGANDPDNKSTTLTSLGIQLSANWDMVRRIGLFDMGSLVSQQDVTGPNITFSGLSLPATDPAGTNNFDIRVTFDNLVADNARIDVTITSATALASGSGFALANAGGATTTGVAAPANQIEVVASALVLSGSPPNSQINTNFPLTLEAKDAQNNVDVDYIGQVQLTATGGGGTLTVQPGQSLTPTLSSGVYNWTTLRISQSGTYELKASDNTYNDEFTDPTASITIQSSASTITPSTDPVLCYGALASAEVIPNIVITETDPAGISGTSLPQSYTFSLALPSGFVFDQTVATGVSVGGGADLNSPSGYSYPGANVVEFSFTLTGTANINTITISGLKAQFPHPGTDAPTPTGTLNITRLGGTANIAGVSAGAVLGTISASQQNPSVTFTIAQAVVTDPPVDPNATTFNVGGPAVKLVSSTPSGSVFTGSGVTFSNPDYRFNPNSLSPGNYPITLAQTAVSGCQSFKTKTFEVLISGMVNLALSYCTNDPPSPSITVSQTYIDQLMGPGWFFDHFVYFDWNISGGTWQPITSPSPTQFDPSLPQYLLSYQTFRSYGYPGLAVGFAVCNGTSYPCDGASPYVRTYQWVDLKAAPTVTFDISKTAFCMGDSFVDLITSPKNSDDTNIDYFRIDGLVDSRLTQSGTPKVWRFTPGPTGASGPVGSFNLTYSYLDPATSCRGTSAPKTITVNEVVTDITFPNNICAGDSVNFLNNTTLRTPATTILTAGWNFGDLVSLPDGAYASTIPSGTVERTYGTYQNPGHVYTTTGGNIIATFTTSDGCVFTTNPMPIILNPIPVANFTWTNACLGSSTTFNATQNLPDGQIQSWNWDFSINDNLTTAIDNGTNKNTSYNYPSIGKDTVRLIITTNNLCRDTVFKPVFIVPTYGAITETNSYTNGFTTADGWIDGGKKSSWQLDTPAGTTIIGDASSTPATGLAWITDTGLPGESSNPNENSFVLSGCFDFSSSTKPVISLDVWSDVPEGIDGAVLQVDTTGYIEELVLPADPDGKWITVGQVDQGINWYDDQGIVSNPGNQTSTSAGWTGKYTNWKKAIFKLDPYIGRQNVLFRIAFGSSNPRGDGFAFDNVFVGERSRAVLLENFTNSNIAPPTGPTGPHNFANYTNLGTAGEVVKIQYHTAFPVDDPINDLNQQMNNARTAFYGVTESPTIRVDGRFNTGNISLWRDDLYDERVLTPSPIKLSVSAVKVGAVVKINTTIENTTTETISVAGINVFTTIVEKSITDAALLGISGNSQFEYVAKQMLPSPAGISLSSEMDPDEILAGATYNVPDIIWENPNGDAIVVFVQSTGGTKKDVHQAFFLDAATVQPDPITGTEDPQYAEKIHLFPNPANHEVNIELPAVVTRSTPVLMFDTYGRSVYENSFAPGEQTKRVNTAELVGGVYIIQISTPEGNVARRKVMVVHR